MFIASLLIAFQTTAPVGPDQQWAVALEKTPLVRRWVENSTANKPIAIGQPGSSVVLGNSGVQSSEGEGLRVKARKPGIPLGNIIQRKAREIRATARAVERRGDSEAAIQILRDGYEQYPVGSLGTLITQMDLRSHRYNDALKDTFSLRQDRDGSELLRIALVTSLNGDVVPGERDYCIYFIRRGVMPEAMEDFMSALPKGESPETITALSAEALANKEGQNDYEAGICDAELANSINPGNPDTLTLLSLFYRLSGRYLDAEKSDEAALSASTSSYLKLVLSRAVQNDAKAVKKYGAVGKPRYILDPVKPGPSP
ncbi:MAG TPA: hypothetical protein VGL56_01655 [Fimbriimonadaceae bacterium]|jgi:tetratricopeptide (TPR) repeat protein